MGDRPRLRDYAAKHGANKLEEESKHYCDLYERYLPPNYDWGGVARLLEIGVQKGGSLKMWSDWCPDAEAIHGIDIKEKCKAGPEAYDRRIKVFVGDQGDIDFLKLFAKTHKPYDVIIDDGSHKMADQRATMYHLWPLVAPGGLYVVEDLHTSYWPEFGGGLHLKGTMMEMLQNSTNHLNTWAIRHKRAGGCRYTGAEEMNIAAIHFHRSICFIEKGGEL